MERGRCGNSRCEHLSTDHNAGESAYCLIIGCDCRCLLPEPRYYECHKHGVQAGDNCPKCVVRAFLPPPPPNVDRHGKPRYSFGDVKGAMKDGTSISVGVDSDDRVNIEFDYTDTLTGQRYHVSAVGRRTEIKE